MITGEISKQRDDQSRNDKREQWELKFNYADDTDLSGDTKKLERMET